MITIEVKGFQSIAGATLQVEGFTALAGKSNIGKSAFVRAVRCALTNPTGTSFVRHGRDCARQARKNAKTCDCFSSVHIVTDGFNLLWEKGDRVNRYTFNGKEYDKPDRGVPDFLQDAGLALVKVGDKTGSIQVADQFFPIFLLDQSGPAIAEAISDVSQLDCINAATRLVEKDRREVQATRKVREKDITELEAKLSTYDTLDEKLKLVRDAEKVLLAITEQSTKVQTLERYLRSLEALKRDMVALGKASTVEVPEVSSVVEAEKSALRLYAFLGDLGKRSKEVRGLAEAEKGLRDFPDENPLPSPLTKLDNLKDWMAQLRRLKEGFASFESVSNLEVPDCDSMTASVAKLKHMVSFSARGNATAKASTEIQAALNKLESEERALAEELVPLNKALSEIEVCSTCNRPLKGSHSHAETFFSFPD